MPCNFLNRSKTECPMIGSKTASNIMPFQYKVSNTTQCDIYIYISDDLTIYSSLQGVRRVKWHGEDGPISVTLFNSLVAPEVSMSLLSVPALVKNELTVLFVTGKAFISNPMDGDLVNGYAK